MKERIESVIDDGVDPMYGVKLNHLNIAPESGLLAAVCLADLVSTLWLVFSHGASEANPIMGFYLEMGPVAFALAKALTFMVPIFALELLRRRRPNTIRAIMKAAVVAYVLAYCLGIWHVNSKQASAYASDTSGPRMHWAEVLPAQTSDSL